MQLLLRRHRKGEKGDYISQRDVEGFSLGENYPGHYYRPVKVCAKCFQVYNLVEKERNMAMAKIARRERQGLSDKVDSSGRPMEEEDEDSPEVQVCSAIKHNSRIGRAYSK